MRLAKGMVVEVGVKVMTRVQLSPAARVKLHVLLASLNSDPPWPEKVKGANDKELLLVLVMVTTCSGEVLSRLVGGKSMPAGKMAGDPAAGAMQDRGTPELRTALERRAADALGRGRTNLAG